MPTLSDDPLYFCTSNVNSAFFYPVSELECSDIIKSLKCTKQDVDHIKIGIFKEFHNYYTSLICDIINNSISSGIFPDCMKIAKIIPIYKKGSKHDLGNYRPISILPFFSKILEKCIHNRLYNFFMSNNLFSPRQFGFLKGRSTEQAVVTLLEFFYSVLNDKEYSINIFVDLSKAFDTVKHGVLVNKLQLYGIRGVQLNLISSYLKNRFQYVTLNAQSSNRRNISSGVPQGSILGPILFLIYINDLPNISNDFSTVLYADDTTISVRGSNFTDLVSSCNAKLDRFNNWCAANRLSINSSKTSYMVVSNRTYSDISLSLNGSNLQLVDNCKFLGVIVDNRLKFDMHINKVCEKISKSLGVMYKLKNIVPSSTLISLYYALIYPHLNYCNLAWGNTYLCHLEKLFLLQKRAVRIVCNANYLAHTNPLFISTKILKIFDIYKLNLAVYIYKNSLQNSFPRRHLHDTRFRSNLLPVFQRLTSTQRSLNFSAPSFWNELPNEIKTCSSLNSLKFKVKEFLIAQYNTI